MTKKFFIYIFIMECNDMKELENQGYVEKDRSRNEAGCYQGTVYTVREVPRGEENS